MRFFSFNYKIIIINLFFQIFLKNFVYILTFTIYIYIYVWCITFNKGQTNSNGKMNVLLEVWIPLIAKQNLIFELWLKRPHVDHTQCLCWLPKPCFDQGKISSIYRHWRFFSIYLLVDISPPYFVSISFDRRYMTIFSSMCETKWFPSWLWFHSRLGPKIWIVKQFYWILDFC